MTNAIKSQRREHVAPFHRAAGVSLGLFGCPWLLPTPAPPPPPGALIFAVTSAALTLVAFEIARTRANARWRAAWDRHAELELARATIEVQPVRDQVRGR